MKQEVGSPQVCGDGSLRVLPALALPPLGPPAVWGEEGERGREREGDPPGRGTHPSALLVQHPDCDWCDPTIDSPGEPAGDADSRPPLDQWIRLGMEPAPELECAENHC